MNNKKMILGFASTIIAVIALVITINLILNFKTNESNQTATLFTNMGSQVSEIDSGESVAELGVLRFGKFALFQLIDETSYEGQADSKAARFMALGELSSLHLQALHDIHGDTYINKYGIKMYWADAIGRYVTIPGRDE